MAKLTAEACRAARAILKWSMRDLARIAGVSPATVNLLESDRPYRQGTAAKIVQAFARSGVEITNGEGTGARIRAFWRIAKSKEGGGYMADRHPSDGRADQIASSRAELEGSLRNLGQSQSATDPDVWFDPF